MRCIRCGSAATRRDGRTRLGGQRWRCTACRRRFTARSSSAFSGHGFADEIVTLEPSDGTCATGSATTVLAALRRGCPCLLSASRWEVARRRDVLPPRWPMGVLLSGDRRGWAGSGGILYSKRRNASAAQAFFERALLRRWLSRPSVSSPTGRGATRPHYGRSCRASSIGARDT
jgi:hypothetical protein